MSEWVQIADRLPDKTGQYLVRLESGDCVVAKFSARKNKLQAMGVLNSYMKEWTTIPGEEYAPVFCCPVCRKEFDNKNDAESCARKHPVKWAIEDLDYKEGNTPPNGLLVRFTFPEDREQLFRYQLL